MNISLPGRLGLVPLGLIALIGLATTALGAVPNDNFASAELIPVGFNDWGTVNGTNATATAEPGEPRHAGTAAANSVWYSWTAPKDGTIYLDAFNSSFSARVAVYNGTTLSNLSLVAASESAVVGGKGGGARFRASAGTTYFVAVDTSSGAPGPFGLNWAYHSSGLFRFSSATYSCAETENQVAEPGDVGNHSVSGVVITITRLFGSDGRVAVNYQTTTNGTAVPDTDYTSVQGQLIFENQEMSRSFVVPIIDDGGIAADNRDFGVALTTVALTNEFDTLISPPRIDAAISNATVTILDVDVDPAVGPEDPPSAIVNFEKTAYRVSEPGGTATIYVYRYGTNLAAKDILYSVDCNPANRATPNWNTFALQPGSDYATPDLDYVQPVNDGTANKLHWDAGQFASRPITITISNDNLVEFNEDLRITLYVPPGGGTGATDPWAKPGNVAQTTLTILFDDYPAGGMDPTFNQDFTTATSPPNNPHPGANGTVFGVAMQTDDRPVIVGNFTAYNTTPRNRIARLTADGYLDPSFAPGSGADDFINTVALTPAGQIIIGGGFTSFNGSSRRGVARLNSDGSLDANFNPGLGAAGTVWGLDVQLPNGQVVIGGDFVTVNGEVRKYVARLNPNGSVDQTFNPAEPDGIINAVAIDSTGKVIIGGAFSALNGVRRRCIARLNVDGSLDNTFNPGTGVDGPVYAIRIQTDNKILIGGAFTQLDLRQRNSIARLNTDGSLDTTFNPGTGMDGPVYCLGLELSNGTNSYIYAGGLFSSYNNTRRLALARLFVTGELDTGFLDTAYNQFAGFPTGLFTPEMEARSFIFGIGMQQTTNVIAGGGFQRVGGGRNSGNIRPDLTSAESDGYTRKTWRQRSNVARLLGGSTTGPGSIGFAQDAYTVDQNYGTFPVTLVRANGNLGQAGANFSLPYAQPGPGIALSGKDFNTGVFRPLYPWTWSNTQMKSDGSSGNNYSVNLTIPPSTLVQGNRSIGMELAMPTGADVFYLGGENIPLGSALATSTAKFTIVDNNRPVGTLSFTASNFVVNEGGGAAVITVTRTNGSAGQVTVQFQTTTATNGFPPSPFPATPSPPNPYQTSDYYTTNGSLTLGDGITNASFAVRVIDNSLVQADRTVNLRLLSPGGGATLGLSNAVLTIIDNDFKPGHLNFSAASYSTNKNAGAAIITVTRTGGSLNQISVQAITTGLGTAIPGFDYTPVTNTLSWNSGDSSSRTFSVPILANGVPQFPDRTVTLALANFSNTGTAGVTNAVLTIVNDDFYGDLSFNTTNYTVMESGGYATVTVIRRGGSAGGVQVNYSTVDGTALAGRDYVAASGTLVFAANELAKSFNVTILDSAATNSPYPNGQLAFNINLSGVQPPGPPPATVSTPQARVTIIDNEQYYNVPSGSVETTFVPAGGLNGDVRTLALQPDGKIVVGGDFTFAGDYSRNSLARFKPDASLDLAFLHDGGGANDSIRTLVVQSDQRTIIGGLFTSIGGYNLKYLARLNFDGTVDSGFNPGAVADNPVYALAECFIGGSRKILAGGAFASFNQLQYNHIVRLNDNGSVDASFQPNMGASDSVYAIAVYPNDTLNGGKILIGGSFTNFNGSARNGIARLNPDGSLDSTFNPGAGADGTVRAIAIQLDGRVLIGGTFANFNGHLSSGIARLNSDGSLDLPFAANLGQHTNGTVYAIALQPDTRILLGGSFSSFSGVTRSNITRLNFDGTVDTSINFGGGANGYVGALVVQTDNNIVLGGGFTMVGGESRPRLARIYGGSLGGLNPSGSFEFALPVFSYNKSETNSIVTIRREGGTAGTNVTVDFLTADGTAIAGVNYIGVSNTLAFPPGETFARLRVPIIPDSEIGPDRTVGLFLTNPQPANAAQLGLQPQATLLIVNDNCAVRFSDAAYSRNENAPDGRATISVTRYGSLLNAVSVNFATLTNGTARPGVDFTMVNQTVTFLAGQTNQNVFVPIFNGQVLNGDKTVVMQLADASGPGVTLGSPSQATLTIINDIRIGQPTNNAFLNARGIAGPWGTTTANTVGASAEPGEPAHAGQPATNSIWFAWVAPADGAVTFDTFGSDFDTVLAAYTGSSLATLNTVAANDYIYPATPVPLWSVNVPKFVPYSNPSKISFNARAGTIYYVAVDGKLGATGNASLSWSYHSAGVFRFSADYFVCSKMDSTTTSDNSTTRSLLGARVTVTRVAGATGRALVDLITADGSATALTDYTTVLATLVFDDWEMSKSVVIPITPNLNALSNRQFTVNLINPRLDPSESTAVLSPRLDPDHATATVNILDVQTMPNLFNLPIPPTIGSNMVNFDRATYRTTEGVGTVNVRVRRWGTFPSGVETHYIINTVSPPGSPDYQDSFFELQAGSDYATPNPTNDAPPTVGPADFDDITGTISWGLGQVYAYIPVPIHKDTVPEVNEDFQITLYAIGGHANDTAIGNVSKATVTILYDDYPAGAVDTAFNPDNELYSQPPMNTGPGANALVYAMLLQPDDKAIIGGNFTTYNNTNRNHIARLNTDGTLDTSFDPQAGVAYGINQRLASVTCAARDGSGRIVIGGLMTTYNGVQRNGVARLNANGSLDNTFNPGLGTTGAVWAVAIQPDGKILVAGEFTSFDTQTRRHIARLNADGSLDSTFDPGPAGPNDNIYALALGSNGATNPPIFIGGAFTSAGGLLRGGIARLNWDGTLDSSFAPLLGANGVVRALAVQPDGKVLLGGEFTRVDNLAFSRLARLNANGRVDTSFQPGSGADDTVFNITLQTDGSIYIGGLFTSFNGTHRVGFARLLPSGLVDTSFLDTAYNQFAGLPKPYFNSDVNPKNFVLTSVVESDGKVLIGGSFTRVGGGRIAFDVYGKPAVQTNLTASWMEKEPNTRAAIRSRANVARLLNTPTVGPGNLGFVQDSYRVNENGGYTFVQVTRDNGTLGRLGANVALPERTPGVGKAQAGVDYTFSSVGPLYETTHWGSGYGSTRGYSDGIWGTNNISFDVLNRLIAVGPDDVIVTIRGNSALQQDQVAPLQLDSPSQMDSVWLGGENVAVGGALGLPAASLTILSDFKKPGVVGFAVSEYFVNEADGNAVITLTRTNGSDGVVSIQYTTTNGTATAGVDYTASTGTLTFLDGQPSASFNVPIINGTKAGPDTSVNLRLFNPSGGVALGATNAVLFIINDNFAPGHVNFSAGSYVTNGDASAGLVTVTRTGGNAGAASVQVAATDGTNALNGRDYIAFTNTLVWNDGDTAPKTVTVPILGSTTVQPDKQVLLRLFNPSTNGLIGNVHSNATLTILNNHFYGTVQFLSSVFNVKENGGTATVTAIRTGGSSDTIAVNYTTSDGTAVSGSDYLPVSGTLVFTNGEVSKTFDVQIKDNIVQDGNRFLRVSLFSPSPANTLGAPSVATLTIVDDETYNEPAGSVDTAFNTSIGADGNILALAVQSDNRVVIGGEFGMVNQVVHGRIARVNPYDAGLDNDFWATIDATVRTLVSQSDDRILIGGDFTNVNGVVLNRIARLSYDGTLDSSFNPGAGADGSVYAIAETFLGGARKVMVGGSFTVLNSISRNSIARLNDDGSVDTSFNPGAGADGTIYAVAVYPTNTIHGGKVVIGGSFATVGGVSRKGIARLNVDGSVDTTFDPGSGVSDIVRALAIQTDGRLLLGGSFANVNGVTRNRVARLNGDGSVDAGFVPGLGANDSVYSIAVQQDQRILLGGAFTLCSGVTRGRLTRLLSNGAVDPMINFGSGANSFVAAVAIQQEPFLDNPLQRREKILIGGGFTQFNGVSCQHLARIYGGSLDGMGSFEFTASGYSADENGTNTLITIRRTGGTSGPQPDGATSVTFYTADGTAVAGVNYVGVTNTLTFPLGETLASVLITVKDDLQINPDRTVNLILTNPQPAIAGGPQLGRQPFATLTILNDDAGVSFDSATYSRDKNANDGAATIRVIRFGNTRSVVSVDFATTTNGTAVIGTDYLPVTNTVVFLAGETNQSIKVPIVNNSLVEGNRTVTMSLSNALGALLLQPMQAVLTIIDSNHAPGQFFFPINPVFVSQGAGNAVITVLRTNGSTGVVTVDFATIPGTAIAGVDYVFTSNTLVFAEGELSKQILIPIIQHPQAGLDRSLSVVLTRPTGGAAILGTNTASLTILDNHEGFTFSAPVYTVVETNTSVSLTVLRQNGSNHLTTVHYSTTNLTARAGVNYVAITNGTLTFNPGETIKGFSVSVLHDTNVTGNLFFGVNLFAPTLPAQVFNYSNAVVNIFDVDPGLKFGSTNLLVVTNAGQPQIIAGYGVLKSTSTNVVITVLRTNANTGLISVRYATVTNANDTAESPLDYTASTGLLTFSNGVTLQSFNVPINPNKQVRGNRTFSIILTNQTLGTQLIPPSVASVTITDDIAGLSFSSPVYSKEETGGSATITVVRGNYTNSTVSVDFATANGTAQVGVNYFPTNGTLTFTNGETVKTFTVQLKDDGVVSGDHTVLLSLANIVGNAVLADPGAATLTVVEADGSLVIPAGASLISESVPANGVIDAGETVTVLFALRSSLGTSTTNLVATLLTTNGVISLSGDQKYGVLLTGGHSVSREFTFKANGTNGQTITATFQLRDELPPAGTNYLREATFSFTLGKTVASYANPAAIVINDNTSASPYPSTINVNGLAGLVTKVTVTLTNFNHTWPSDVDVLLVSPPTPDAPTGRKSLLMAKAGSSFTVSNLTLTFDDAATNSLPRFSQLVSSTNRPTSYAAATPPFPAASTPPPPYGVGLSNFNGINPNGDWSLYIIDDAAGNSGVISNGWVLNLTTAGAVPVAADVGLAMTVSTNPAVVTTNLTAEVVVTSNVIFTVTVTNYGPAGSTNIVVTDTLPVAGVLVSANVSRGTITTNGARLLTWNIPWLATNTAANASETLTMVVQANTIGRITNSAIVATIGTTDPNPDDDQASNVVVVDPPTADLAIVSLVGAPNPVLLGNYLTYTITVLNHGPATATGVTLVDKLPAEVTFVSTDSTNYTPTGQTFTWKLIDLPANSNKVVTITVRPTTAGTITNSTSCSSDIVDPFKANNAASVKTIVQAMTIARVGGGVAISWPADANYDLQSTTNLNPPSVWTKVTNGVPSLVGGQTTVVVPIGPGNRYFRLHQTP